MRTLLLFALLPLAAFAQGTTPTFQVKTLSELTNTPIPSVNNRISALVTGRLTENDGYGGLFFYQTNSTTTVDDGTVVKPASVNGRWIREYSGAVQAGWFGVVGDGVTDDIVAIKRALASGKSPIEFNKRVYAYSGSNIPLTLAGQEVRGDSALSTLFTPLTPGASGFVNGTAGVLGQLYVHDLAFITPPGHLGKSGLDLTNVQDSRFERIYLLRSDNSATASEGFKIPIVVPESYNNKFDSIYARSAPDMLGLGRVRCVDLKGSIASNTGGNSCRFLNCNFLTPNGIAFEFTNCNNVLLGWSIFEGSTTNAVLFSDGLGGNVAAFNRFEIDGAGSIGVHFSTGTTQCKINDNLYSAMTVPILDEGIDNQIAEPTLNTYGKLITGHAEIRSTDVAGAQYQEALRIGYGFPSSSGDGQYLNFLRGTSATNSAAKFGVKVAGNGAQFQWDIGTNNIVQQGMMLDGNGNLSLGPVVASSTNRFEIAIGTNSPGFNVDTNSNVFVYRSLYNLSGSNGFGTLAPRDKLDVKDGRIAMDVDQFLAWRSSATAKAGVVGESIDASNGWLGLYATTNNSFDLVLKLINHDAVVTRYVDAVGYKVSGTGPSGTYLRGNGTAFTLSSLLATDLVGNLPIANFNSGTGANASTFWRGDGQWVTNSGSGTNGGTVTSVAMTVPAFLSVAGSPITGAGTLAVSLSGTKLPLANESSPTSSGFAHVTTGTWDSAARNAVLASSDFSNQGTTTTLLHGNAAGNPSFGQVNLASEVTGNLDVSHLNNGTAASGSTFWAGDGTWKAASGTFTPPTGSGAVTVTGGVLDVASSPFQLDFNSDPAIGGIVKNYLPDIQGAIHIYQGTPGLPGDGGYIGFAGSYLHEFVLRNEDTQGGFRIFTSGIGGGEVIQSSITGNVGVRHFGGTLSGTPSIVVGAAAGSSPSVSLDGSANDMCMTVTLGVGSLSLANGALFTVTFATAYAIAPHIVFSPSSATAAGLTTTAPFVDPANITTTSFVFTSNAVAMVGGTYKWTFHVLN